MQQPPQYTPVNPRQQRQTQTPTRDSVTLILTLVMLGQGYMTALMLMGIKEKTYQSDTKAFVGISILFAGYTSLLVFLLRHFYKLNFNQRLERRHFLNRIPAVLRNSRRVRSTESAIRTNLILPITREYKETWGNIPEEDLVALQRELRRIREEWYLDEPAAERSSENRRRLLLASIEDDLHQHLREEVELEEIDPTQRLAGPNRLAKEIVRAECHVGYLLELAGECALDTKPLINLRRAILPPNDPNYDNELEELTQAARPTVHIPNFKATFMATLEKSLRHQLIQTCFKLGCGAFGWQLIWMKVNDNSDCSSESLHKQAAAWLATGAGASAFLIVGMPWIQIILGKYFQGTPANRLILLCLQLCFSVTPADALWQPLTELATATTGLLMSLHPALGWTFGTAFFALSYLVESFVFRMLHNGLNKILAYPYKTANQEKFHCDREFTGVLWGAYGGFFLIPTLLALAGLSTNSVFLTCLIAGLGTAVLPALIGTGHIQRKLATANTSFTELTRIKDGMTETDKEALNIGAARKDIELGAKDGTDDSAAESKGTALEGEGNPLDEHLNPGRSSTSTQASEPETQRTWLEYTGITKFGAFAPLVWLSSAVDSCTNAMDLLTPR